MTTQETTTTPPQCLTVAELVELVVPELVRSVRERGTPNRLHFDEVDLEAPDVHTRRASIAVTMRLVLERLVATLDGLEPRIVQPDPVEVFELLEAPEHLDEPGQIGEEHLRLGALLGAPVLAWCWSFQNDEDWHYFYAVRPRPELVEALLGECVSLYQEAQREGILEYMRDELSALQGAEEHSEYVALVAEEVG